MSSQIETNFLEQTSAGPPQTVEQIATGIIRRNAAYHASLDPRLELTVVADDYEQPFREVYRPPHQHILSIREIEEGLTYTYKSETLLPFIKAFRESPSTEEALDAIDKGESVALLSNHRELSDTGLMLGAFLIAAARLRPDDAEITPRLIQRSRVIVGTTMEELAPDSNRATSVTDALRYLGGVFKVFPVTEITKTNVAEGLDPTLTNEVNMDFINEFRHQVRDDQISVLALAPSGSVDTLQETEDGKNEFVLGEVSSATGKLIKAFHWLPVAVKLNPPVSYKIGKLMDPIKMEEFMPKVMVPLCNELDPESGIRTRYGG